MTSTSTRPVPAPANQETNRAAREMANARRGSGPPWGAMGMPAEKSMDFGPSVRRLLARLAPERLGVVAVLVLGVVSVTLSVIGPVVLGYATDIIFAGVIGAQLAPGTTPEQAAEAARAHGNEAYANVISGSGVVPGAGDRLRAARPGAAGRRRALRGGGAVRRGRRAACSTGSSSARSPRCAATSRTRSTGCRCATSTGSPAASCSAG